MKRNHHKVKREKGVETPISGGGKLSVTLDQIVDYAKDLDDKDEAERMELMCYRMFARRMTPEAADKIAEISEKFKKKQTPIIKKFVTINKGDKVDKKTVIPRVSNFKPQITTQNMNLPMLPTSQKEHRLLENE